MEEKAIVLIVDDVASNVQALAGVLKDDYNIKVALNGARALELIKQKPHPDLILLDLNMPLKDGREVLREIKTDPNTCHIPVVILSTSINKIDICDSYAHGANAYVRKEVGLQNFMASIQHIEQFWMRTSILPSCCNQHSELA